VQRRLAAIWCELLGVEQLALDDDFFALGGHSLLATRVLARIADTLGVRLALRDVFDAPTVARLAARIAPLLPAAAEAAAEGEREELEF
jgi:acyl carrier protein